MIHEPIDGDGYSSVAMMVWDNIMPEPAVSLAFTANVMATLIRLLPKSSNKADLWHRRLGQPSHDAIGAPALPLLLMTFPGAWQSALAPFLMCAYAARLYPRRYRILVSSSTQLQLVSMDVMGPLHGVVRFTYVSIIHDAFSEMIWVGPWPKRPNKPPGGCLRLAKLLKDRPLKSCRTKAAGKS